MTLRNISHLKHTTNHFVLAFPGHLYTWGFLGGWRLKGDRGHTDRQEQIDYMWERKAFY